MLYIVIIFVILLYLVIIFVILLSDPGVPVKIRMSKKQRSPKRKLRRDPDPAPDQLIDTDAGDPEQDLGQEVSRSQYSEIATE